MWKNENVMLIEDGITKARKLSILKTIRFKHVALSSRILTGDFVHTLWCTRDTDLCCQEGEM